MIKFLQNYTTKGIPPETFCGGQVVKDRDEASEMHFVVRGVAAFVGEDGALSNFEGKPVVDPFADDVEEVGGDGLDTMTTAKLKKIVKAEKVEVADDADNAAIVTAIRAHRAAAEPATDGLDDLSDEELVQRITDGEIAVEPGADRAVMLAALREVAQHAANGQ